MKLKELINSIKCKTLFMNDADVAAVCYDSRFCQPGSLFVAVMGENRDGHDFIADAIKKGANSIVVEKEAGDIQVPQIIVEDSKIALALISARFFSEPAKKLKMTGVTGTNGKTTITYLLESIFKSSGLETGVIGTINYRYKDKCLPSAFTTPQPVELQGLLNEMLTSGVTHCIMEVSSHSIGERRIAECGFDVKIFTNLTPEHLDYHKTMEGYFKCKQEFFTSQFFEPGRGTSVINIDDGWGKKLGDLVKSYLSYSLKDKADIYPLDYSSTCEGIKGKISTPSGAVSIDSALIGEHNLYNIMAAVGASEALGIKITAIENGINALKNVPGRLERINHGDGLFAYVDYAHTPDALERALVVLRGLSKGRIITVFGCGGNRDRTKRPVMGEIAVRLSDLTIITSDNPRDEDALKIIEEIEKGINSVKRFDLKDAIEEKGYMVIPDRGEAIVNAIVRAWSGDTIFVAGKGHENYQIIKGRKMFFDDRVILKKVLEDVHSLKESGKGRP